MEGADQPPDIIQKIVGGCGEANAPLVYVTQSFL
jgi:hypothetical protein